MSNKDNLPVKTDTESFIAEHEVMNIDPLKDKTYMVAVSRESREEGKFVCSTARGPYNFYEMCEEVGVMYREHQHHAKVYVMEKDRNKRVRWLDQNTTDYIEAHYAEIITEGLLDGVFDEVKEFTCVANIIEDSGEEDPRNKKKASSQEDEDDATQ